MSWSKNNQASKSTWFALLNLEQTTKTFNNAEDQRMDDLTFFNPEDTNATKDSARNLARVMSNVFQEYNGATLEDGVTDAAARKGMVEVMTVAEKTIADLAEAVDASYLFLGEGK
jgi:hypothetical protein